MSYLDDAPEPRKPHARMRCPKCRRMRPVLKDGTFRRHYDYGDTNGGTGRPSGPCHGSHKKPEEL